MTAIRLDRITNFALEGIVLDVAHGELLVVVGPSGAGKTSLLNVLAGLMPYRGRVFFGTRPVDRLPTHRRRLGYVFQDLLLLPHLSVEQNLLLAMTRIRGPRSEKKARVVDVATMLRIGHLIGRMPADLSGGEKQRVALARALVCRPQVLLLDEPFSGLDFRTARYLRQEFKQLQRRMGVTTLFVTHNLEEARELADRIAVMRGGRLERTVAPADLLFGGGGGDDFLEPPNLLACRLVQRGDNGLVQVEWAGVTLQVADEGRDFHRLAILPKDVYISPAPPPGPPINRFSGRVRDIGETDGAVRVTVAVNGDTVAAEISRDHLAAMNLAVGDRVHGILKLRALRGC